MKQIPLRSIFLLFLKGALAFICAALVWELILRQTMLSHPGFRVDKDLGVVYRSGLYIHGTEGYSRSRINSLGMREDEIGPRRPGELRVLALGDSFTEAFQVPLDKTYCRRLRDNLNKNMKARVRVINAGRTGASPAAFIFQAAFYNRRIQPDVTIVQINEPDFVNMRQPTENFFAVKTPQGWKVELNRHYGFFQARPRLKRFAFISSISLYQVGKDKLTKLLCKTAPENQLESTDPALPGEIDWAVRALASEYKNLVILFLPTVDYRGAARNESQVERLLEISASRHGAGFVNMRSGFADYYGKYRQPPIGFDNTTPWKGHINAIGHGLAAARLAPLVSARLAQ